MPNDIRLADGSKYEGGAVAGATEAKAATSQVETRTRLVIATALDAAERNLTSALNVVDTCREQVRRLEKELRAFGRKPRKAKV